MVNINSLICKNIRIELFWNGLIQKFELFTDILIVESQEIFNNTKFTKR